MSRFLRATMVAVVAAASTTIAMAQPTATEMYQVFGSASTVNPGSGIPVAQNFLADPNVVVQRGQSIYLPIWLKPLQGNNASFTSIRTYNFEVSAIAGGGAIGTDFVPSSASVRQFGPYTNPTSPTADGSTALSGTGLPAGLTRLFTAFGNNPAPGDAGMRSDSTTGGGLPFDDAVGGYYLGFVTINIGAAAANGATLDLYMHTPTPTGSAKYTTNSTTGSNNSLAYGHNGVNPDNVVANGTGDIIGTLNGKSSGISDAHLTVVVPEPGTLGLLALGVLGIVRRRK